MYGGGEECELSQLSDNSCAQPPHFVVECKHKKTDEKSHEGIKSKRRGREVFQGIITT